MRWGVFLILWSVPAVANPLDPKGPVRDILQKKCGVCHLGPFLNLKDFPITWSESSDPKIFVAELMRRVRGEGWGKMPPANGTPLTCAEILELDRWAQSIKD